jgi:ubiquitin-protein ligase
MITKKILAEAVAKLVDSLHHKYPGIKVKPISNYEDEDFAVEVTIPKDFPIDQVEETCHL